MRDLGARLERAVGNRLAEHTIEVAVSQHIGNMKVLWLAVPDESGPESDRGHIERNAIALLAGQEPASPNWLGSMSGNAAIVKSNLWNVNHIAYQLQPSFFDIFERRLQQMEST